MLWIALNYVSLTDWIQHRPSLWYTKYSCELLWIMYLWQIEYNEIQTQTTRGHVVNCFELCIFDRLNTTILLRALFCNSCELLWIMYLWQIEYNALCRLSFFLGVVNCFELCIFDRLNTTAFCNSTLASSLWIALNYVSLTDWIQQIILRYFAIGVVNCFELCIFDRLNTTDGID